MSQNRRNFLKSAGVAIVGAFVAPKLLAGASSDQTELSPEALQRSYDNIVTPGMAQWLPEPPNEDYFGVGRMTNMASILKERYSSKLHDEVYDVSPFLKLLKK